MTTPTNQELDRMLEKIKKDVFLGNNTAFLGSILCSVDFFWDRTPEFIDQVGTNYLSIRWGVNDFLRCTIEERRSTLLHELWHIACLHNLRLGKRDRKLWNIACDFRINNDLRKDQYFIPDTWVVDPDLDVDGPLAEEQIYDLLIQQSSAKTKMLQGMGGSVANDLIPASEPQPLQSTTQIAAVVRAVQTAEMAKAAGNLPGHLKQILNSFLEPVIPWRSVLHQWMTDLADLNFTWKRPNRRYQDIYLPASELDGGRLEHLVYFEDVSGSISPEDHKRFNSEVKFVQEQLNPEKLTLIQFDTEITQIREFTEFEPFKEIEIVGGGGTSLRPVRDWIEKHQPTAAIIFSDLWCAPMQALSYPVPIIWAVVHHPGATVQFGKLIHITD